MTYLPLLSSFLLSVSRSLCLCSAVDLVTMGHMDCRNRWPGRGGGLKYFLTTTSFWQCNRFFFSSRGVDARATSSGRRERERERLDGLLVPRPLFLPKKREGVFQSTWLVEPHERGLPLPAPSNGERLPTVDDSKDGCPTASGATQAGLHLAGGVLCWLELLTPAKF